MIPEDFGQQLSCLTYYNLGLSIRGKWFRSRHFKSTFCLSISSAKEPHAVKLTHTDTTTHLILVSQERYTDAQIIHCELKEQCSNGRGGSRGDGGELIHHLAGGCENLVVGHNGFN